MRYWARSLPVQCAVPKLQKQSAGQDKDLAWHSIIGTPDLWLGAHLLKVSPEFRIVYLDLLYY